MLLTKLGLGGLCTWDSSCPVCMGVGLLLLLLLLTKLGVGKLAAIVVILAAVMWVAGVRASVVRRPDLMAWEMACLALSLPLHDARGLELRLGWLVVRVRLCVRGFHLIGWWLLVMEVRLCMWRLELRVRWLLVMSVKMLNGRFMVALLHVRMLQCRVLLSDWMLLLRVQITLLSDWLLLLRVQITLLCDWLLLLSVHIGILVVLVLGLC